MKIFLTYVIMAVSFWPAAGRAETGKYGADAITVIGPGTRAQALGGSFTGLADDASCVYWNPAGLPQIKKHQLFFSHLSLFGGLAQYDFVALAVPMPNKVACALSWTRVGVDNIPEYQELQGTPEERKYNSAFRSTGEPVGYFNGQEVLFQGSFAKMLEIRYFTEQIELLPDPIKFYLGLNMKWYRQVLYDFTGTYTALDGGILMNIGLNYSLFGETPRRDLLVGLMLQNALATKLAWNTPGEASDQVPTVTRWGIAYKENLVRFLSTITCSYERDRDYSSTDHFGLQYNFKDIMYLCMGYSRPAWSTGAGFTVKHFSAGYAFTNHAFAPLHTISLSYEF